MQFLLHDARALVDPERDRQTEAFWVHEVVFSPKKSVAAVRQAAGRYLNRVDSDTGRRERWHEGVESWSRLSASLPADQHFEALSGHRLVDFDRPTKQRKTADRPPVRRAVRRNRSVLVLPALVLLGLMVGVLGMPYPSPDPFAARGAGVSGYAWEEVGLRVRGAGDGTSSHAVPTYHDAMKLARQSRRVYAGFLVRYDTDTLLMARQSMLQAMQASEGRYAVPPQAKEALQVMDDILATRHPAGSGR